MSGDLRRLVVLLVLMPGITLAQNRPSTAKAPPRKTDVSKSKIDEQVKSLIDGEYCTGILVATIDSNGQHVYGYGLTAKKDGKTPAADTVFELGSVTKIFTASVLAQMADKMEVDLSSPVDALLPGMKIPSDGGNKIWLIHLADHTSGLPPQPTNLVSPKLDNPYFGYGQSQFEKFLATFMLPRMPGDRYEYSHVGYGLLGQAIARKNNKSYEQTIVDRLCTPLEMNDTRITLTPDMQSRLARGYTADGDAVDLWDCPPLEGALGLRSTASDLLKLASAHLELTKTPFAAAFKSMQQRQSDADRQNDMGIGWQIGRRINVLWHPGETGGCHVFLALLPKDKSAVIVLANSATGLVDILGINLVRLMIGEPAPPLGMKIARKISPAILDQYVGEYMVSREQSLTVSRDGDNLYVQATGQLKLKLYAESENRFFGKAVDRLIEFNRGPSGNIESLTFHQGTQQVPAQKVK